MAMTTEDLILKFNTGISTMSAMAEELPRETYSRVRLEAKANAMAEALDIFESMVMGTVQETALPKYELAQKLIWADYVDADIKFTRSGPFQENLFFAEAVGTRDGFAIALDYLKNITAENT
jgi:hypothetical protein